MLAVAAAPRAAGSAPSWGQGRARLRAGQDAGHLFQNGVLKEISTLHKVETVVDTGRRDFRNRANRANRSAESRAQREAPTLRFLALESMVVFSASFLRSSPQNGVGGERWFVWGAGGRGQRLLQALGQ